VKPADLRIDLEKVDKWLAEGAEMSDTVASLVRKAVGRRQQIAVRGVGPEEKAIGNVVAPKSRRSRTRRAAAARRRPRRPAPAAPAGPGRSCPDAAEPAEPEPADAAGRRRTEGTRTRVSGPPGHLVVGHITKAHGTKGELFVWPLTDRPEAVFAPGQSAAAGRRGGRARWRRAVCRGRDGPRRSSAAARQARGRRRPRGRRALARRYLLLPADTLPPLDEDEVFYHELLGMRW
jgi:hypothetical protein